jgi:hypothetical protein
VGERRFSAVSAPRTTGFSPAQVSKSIVDQIGSSLTRRSTIEVDRITLYGVKHKVESFRLAGEILSHRKEWKEFEKVLNDLSAKDVLSIYEEICGAGKRPPAGGQIPLNEYFRRKLIPLNWKKEPKLFNDPTGELRGWKMDFLKNKIGVEITFNHAEAIPWIFSRLNIAGESERVQPSSKIEVGIAVFATESMKRWSKMDNAVSTFELASAWLREMKPILPIPLLLVGLEAKGWTETTSFRGTSRGTRST